MPCCLIFRLKITHMPRAPVAVAATCSGDDFCRIIVSAHMIRPDSYWYIALCPTIHMANTIIAAFALKIAASEKYRIRYTHRFRAISDSFLGKPHLGVDNIITATS